MGTTVSVRHPGPIARLIGKIPIVGPLADSLDIIPSTDRRIVERRAVVTGTPDLQEAAQIQLSEAQK
jgi:hypothetical protein